MRILLVDDDTAVIQALLAVLRALPGHEVRVATTGAKGLENAEALGGLDLLITDVVMEGMDGFTLRNEITARYPGARTILISGYDLTDYAEQTAGCQVLSKPIDAATLVAAIEQEFAEVVEEPELQPAAAVPAAPQGGTFAHPAAPRVVPPSPAAHVPTAPPPRAASPPTARPPAPKAPQPHVVRPPGARPAAPQPRAVAVPGARAGAAPRAPMAQPQRPPAGIPRVQQPIGSTVTAAPQIEMRITSTKPEKVADPLVGQALGTYQIVSRIGTGAWGAVYHAVQTAINRPVALKVLDPAHQDDEADRARFVADARLKAHVQHPSILAVYEAGETDGRVFYAHEYVDGQNLEQLRRENQLIDEKTALKLVRVAADGFAYLHARNIPHSALEGAHVYISTEGTPRLANLASQESEEQIPMEDEIRALGQVVLSVLPAPTVISPGLRALLLRMVKGGAEGFPSWAALLQACKALEPRTVPSEAAARINAQDRAAIEAVEAARRQQKRSLYLTIASLAATLALVAWVIWFYVFRSNERVLDAQVQVPAGEYIVGDGQKVTLGAFWIDKYEVTIGQYAKFLEFLKDNPAAEGEVNHPRQPKYLTHRPKDWEIYFGQARAGGAAHGVPITLNSPVMMVTWWDAYAYAKWRGRELPSEAEWEAAGRGPQGYTYPWGEEFDPKKVNSNADFDETNPAAKGAVDGFNWWGEVDGVGGDKSFCGAVGLAGNVSEWVNTWTPNNRFAIVKGGDFRSPDVKLTRRDATRDPSKGEEFIGFRTISRTPPAQ